MFLFLHSLFLALGLLAGSQGAGFSSFSGGLGSPIALPAEGGGFSPADGGGSMPGAGSGNGNGPG